MNDWNADAQYMDELIKGNKVKVTYERKRDVDLYYSRKRVTKEYLCILYEVHS